MVDSKIIKLKNTDIRNNYSDVKGVKSYKKQYISKTALIIYKSSAFINQFNLMFLHGRMNIIHDEMLLIHWKATFLINTYYF